MAESSTDSVTPENIEVGDDPYRPFAQNDSMSIDNSADLSDDPYRQGTSKLYKDETTSLAIPTSYLGTCIKTAFVQTIVLPLNYLNAQKVIRSHKSLDSSVLSIYKSTLTRSGIAGFFTGADVMIAKSFFFTLSRLKTYYALNDYYKGSDINKKLTGLEILKCTLISTFATSFISTPFDLVLTRMQTCDLAKPDSRNYKGLADGFQKIVKEEGPIGLFRGNLTLLTRSMLANFISIVCFVIRDANQLGMLQFLAINVALHTAVAYPFENLRINAQFYQDGSRKKFQYYKILKGSSIKTIYAGGMICATKIAVVQWIMLNLLKGNGNM